MNLQQYLLETFQFNDQANRKMISRIRELPDQKELIRFMSHLINCQYKWMARVQGDPHSSKMDWWEPLYKIDVLEEEWNNSLTIWINYLQQTNEEQLQTEVQFIGFDGSLFAAKPLDIALQLNYHSIHHRAQMQMMIRQQGIEPDFIDYIGTKYRKL